MAPPFPVTHHPSSPSPATATICLVPSAVSGPPTPPPPTTPTPVYVKVSYITLHILLYCSGSFPPPTPLPGSNISCQSLFTPRSALSPRVHPVNLRALVSFLLLAVLQRTDPFLLFPSFPAVGGSPLLQHTAYVTASHLQRPASLSHAGYATRADACPNLPISSTPSWPPCCVICVLSQLLPSSVQRCICIGTFSCLVSLFLFSAF